MVEIYANVDCFVILNICLVLVYCVLECCLGVSSVLLLTLILVQVIIMLFKLQVNEFLMVYWRPVDVLLNELPVL